MSTPALTPVSYVVLGLAAHGATTPYDMKRKVAGSVGYFWNFPHSQLYAEPARLAELGLLEEQTEQSGRRRRIFTITDKGRQALHDWLREPATEPTQIRDTGLLKLFFGGELNREEIAALAHVQEQAHLARLATYQAIEQTIDDPRHTATLRAGLLFEQTFIDFWRRVAEGP
jgi:PadR family transcriptional regulator, regulatory protein AphA